MPPNKRVQDLATLTAALAADASHLAVVSQSGTAMKSARFDVLRGALKRIGYLYDVLDPKFGAAGDGTTDDLSAFTSALSNAQRGATVIAPFTPNGYKLSDTITVPAGVRLLLGTPGGTLNRFADNSSINSSTTPGTGQLVITHTNPGIVLRSNSVVQGATFWYPSQTWGITSLASSFTSYTAIQLGDSTDSGPYHPRIRNCQFLGATRCISQYATDGTSLKGLSVSGCTGVLLGEFLRVARSTEVMHVNHCHLTPNAVTAYVGDASVGGDATVFRTKAAQAGKVFHLGNVDDLQALDVFAFGVLHFAHYNSGFYTGDANSGFGGTFTNCASDGCYQAFRVERSGNVFPLVVQGGWYTPIFRPNGASTDSDDQALLFLQASVGTVRTSLSNIRVNTSAPVAEFSNNYSGVPDYAYTAGGSIGAGTNVLANGMIYGALTLGLADANMATVVNPGAHTINDALRDWTMLSDIDATGGYRQTIDGWYQENAAASQTAVTLARLATTTNNPNAWIAPRSGSITAIAVLSNAARTAGTLTVEAYINGVATGLTAVLDGTNTTFKASTQAKGTDAFVAGDKLDIRITTTGAWLPTTADVRASLEVET